MTLSIFDAAVEAGDHPALVFEGRSVTYRELAQGARAMLRALPGDPRRPTAPIAVVGDDALSTFVLILAAFAAGVPVLLLHPRVPRSAHMRLCGRCRAHLVAPEQLAEEDSLSACTTKRGESENGCPVPPVPDDERPLVILPTSGSAGEPKGIVLSRRAMVAAAQGSALNLGWKPQDRWLLALPLAHIGGLSVLTRCLLARRTIVVARDNDPATIADTVERSGVTLLSLVPTQLVRLLGARHQLPSCVRAILLGGAPATRTMLAAAADRDWPVLTTYGLTEAASQVTTQPYGTSQRGELGAGLPLSGSEVSIRSGRVAVRSPTLASGFLADAAFAPEPMGGSIPMHPLPLDEDGWLVTNDLGYLDVAGNLHVQGRADHLILTGGENVMPERLEAELLSLPEIADAAVVGRPDPEWGERVVACVVWAEPSRPPPIVPLATLRARLKPHLASHELPRELLTMSQLPRLPTGKLDRRRLAAQIEGAPAGSREG
ncbi:MAG: AMP-binding protein [Polyangiaceae bacterium]|nr:AMP-binding protein [Polyangiaceae bacterium]